MEGIKRIVIPVDNTEDSKKAVKKGAYLAKLLGVDAEIITVNDTHQFMSSVVLEEKLKKEAEVFLQNFKKMAEEFGIKIETQLMVGNPSEEIVKHAKTDDLIVMAHHDTSKGIDRFMETCVSRDVVRNAPCSVLVLK
jgi:nucleotide-binding universal stress UspA family protein